MKMTIVVIGAAMVLSQTAAGPKVPLKPGLTMVVAFSLPHGDGESMGRLDTIDARGLHLTLSGEIVASGGGPLDELLGTKSTTPAKPQRIRVKRTVLASDLQSARHLQSTFGGRDPAVFPGSTTLRISTALYSELKKRGQAELSCECAGGLSGMAAGLGSALGSLLGELGSKPPELKELGNMGRLSGTVKVVGTKRIPMLVNDARVELTVMHVRGRLGDEDAEFNFLDDPDNPLVLSHQVGSQRAQAVKISFPATETAPPIATALDKTGRAEVYGIYFDFGSAAIKPESEPVLKEIAAALTSHPAWNLGIEGHTDDIGGEAENVDLSRRRAAAVKDALVSRHQIAATRLTPAGFGESRPKETNDTLDGRARNRRVELVRQ